MTQPENSAFSKREVAESAFDYLLNEVLSLSPLRNEVGEASDDRVVVQQKRLDEMGYEVGYRCVLNFD
jgi:hypothetical protein